MRPTRPPDPLPAVALPVLVSLLGCTPHPAQRGAAPPPNKGAAVIEQMHDRYAGTWYHTLTFRQATDRRTPADTLVHETWYETALIPGRLRIDVGAPNGDPVILFANDSTYVARGGHVVTRRAGRNDLLVLGFDVYRQPATRTLAILRDEGFDLSRTHEMQWQGRRTYVIGAAAGDTTSKQFWIDADRLVFVRMLEPGTGTRPATDIRFDQYRPAGQAWVAVEVSALSGGKMMQHELYSEVRTDVPVDPSRLTPAGLGRGHSRVRGAATPGPLAGAAGLIFAPLLRSPVVTCLPLVLSLLSAACNGVPPSTAAAPRVAIDTATDIRSIPIVVLQATHPVSSTLAIVLSGDGGWADIDQKVGERLQARGIDVVGIDMRAYLRSGHRTPAGIGADVSRLARVYMRGWQRSTLALVGYSRGSDLEPFAATHLAPDIRPRLRLVAFLALLERASFAYHFSDLWRMTSGGDDIPILPQLEQLHQAGIPMLCIYGKDEPESLCRTAPAGLMTVVQRNGKHHFDGNYTALADLVYDEIMRTAPHTVAAGR